MNSLVTQPVASHRKLAKNFTPKTNNSQQLVPAIEDNKIYSGKYLIKYAIIMNSIPKKACPISYPNIKFYKICYALTGQVISSSNQSIPTIIDPPCHTNTTIPINNPNQKIKSIKIPSTLKHNISNKNDKSDADSKYVVKIKVIF